MPAVLGRERPAPVKEQWLAPDGVVHIMPLDHLLDGLTWCGTNPNKRFAGKVHPPDLTELPPTCFVCIAQAVRYYALPMVRRFHAR